MYDGDHAVGDDQRLAVALEDLLNVQAPPLLGYGSRHLFSRLGEERDLVRPLEGIGSAVQLLDAESGTLGGLFETDGPFLSVAAGVAGSAEGPIRGPAS